MKRGATRLRLVAATAVLAVGLTGLGTVAPLGATAAAPLHVLAGSVAPTLPTGSRVTGALAGTAPVSFDVVLRLRNGEALAALLAGLYDPHSAQFGRFLTASQFARRFGPTRLQVGAVETWLRAEGVTPTSVSANRLLIGATAPASVAGAALRTSFVVVRSASGRRAYANLTAPSVPSGIAGIVTGIVGLDDLVRAHDELVRLTAHHRGSNRSAANRLRGQRGPRACAGAQSYASSNGTFTAPGLASYYAMAPLYGLGDLGQGVRVGIAEFEANSATDIAAFQACYRTATHVGYAAIDNGLSGTGVDAVDPGSGEAALDIENVIGTAPRSWITVYQTPNTDQGDVDMYSAMVADGNRVISTSWGSCEPETTPSTITAELATFEEASALGDAVFAASGDSGSTDCYPNASPTSDNPLLTVDDPASQPYVVGVGGTSVSPSGEVVWHDSVGGSGGGGVSEVHCMPAYQANQRVPGTFTKYSRADAALCGGGFPWLRQVPDVAADADPSTGYTLYWGGSWGGIGGTSGAAPLWAGAAALVLASPYCRAMHSVAGITPQSLYAIASSPRSAAALHDITSGRNAVAQSGYRGGLYSAHRGYDEASGLGSPLLTDMAPSGAQDLFHPGLAALACFESRTVPVLPRVSAVVPDRVSSAHPTRVTILGSGLLAIPGAVRAEVDGVIVDATCTSSIRCTAVLPALHAITAHLRLGVLSLALSPPSAHDLVTFVAPRGARSVRARGAAARGLATRT